MEDRELLLNSLKLFNSSFCGNRDEMFLLPHSSFFFFITILPVSLQHFIANGIFGLIVLVNENNVIYLFYSRDYRGWSLFNTELWFYEGKGGFFWCFFDDIN